MRLFLLLPAVLMFSFLFFGCSEKGSGPAAPPEQGAATPEATEKTSPPPKPPYSLTSKDELAIDAASDRLQFYVLSPKESEEKLAEYQEKLKKCDEELAQKKDSCKARFATLYCMLIGDRYFEQGKSEEATKYYLDAVKRTYTEHMSDLKTFEAEQKKPFDPASGETARIMTRAYTAARFHFQAYKDFAETARYQKRVIEVILKQGDEAKAKEQWSYILESVKSAASYKNEFFKDWEELQAIKDKIPESFMVYYSEIEKLASDTKIEKI